MRSYKEIGPRILTLFLCLSIVGCGGDDSDDGDAAGNPSESSPTTALPTEDSPSGGSAHLSEVFDECMDGLGFTFSELGDVTMATHADSGHTFEIRKLASEEDAVAFVEGVDTLAYAQAGPYVAVGDNDDANEVMAPLTGCLNAENLTQ